MDHTFFDLQVNGFAGVDFQDPATTVEDAERAARALREFRTPQILLTLVTDEAGRLLEKFRRFERFREASPVCRETFVGYHLEGPYLSSLAGFCGAHQPQLMRAPDRDEFARLQDAANGRIRLVTLAPEWPGSPEFIAWLRAQGVAVAIGHSDASHEEIGDAIAAGLTLCTHLGNGVPSQMHRHDNIMQRLLARDELTACFIPDGIHVPPFVLKNFVRCKSPDKVLFTTDCMAAGGAGPGSYRIGHIMVQVGADRVVREPGKDNFAGSSLDMPAAFRNVREWLGWGEKEAAGACGDAVRRTLGLE